MNKKETIQIRDAIRHLANDRWDEGMSLLFGLIDCEYPFDTEYEVKSIIEVAQEKNE